jgi:hypothetical protein
MQQSIHVLSLAPDANDWLLRSRHPRILHIFEHACNLINERGEVLSLATPRIGNGPFNLVVEKAVCFLGHIDLQSQISISSNQLCLGDLTFSTGDAKIWNPNPDWKSLHAQKGHIADQLTKLSIMNYRLAIANSQSLISNLCCAIANADLPSSPKAASQLAGLGIGLTPSGDDFMMGAIYAAWIIHPPEVARILAQEVANTAAPLTTSLSAAWLKSAAKGEAGIVWHLFLDALVSGDSVQAQKTVKKILAIGETSGADALAGFAGVFAFWMETWGSSN